MDINVNIKAPGLAEALNNIAIALSAMANLSGAGEVLPGGTPVEQQKETTEAPLKGSALKKHQISEEIVALGGTPPEKGSMAVFETALEAAKLEAAEMAEEPTVEDENLSEEPEDIPVGDVRTLACAVLKKGSDEEGYNPAKCKAALGGCLKKVKAENLTKATPKQLNAIVPLLEEYLGKSLAEVLEEAAD